MSHEEHERLTLANLGNGGAEELFQEELKRVLENIADPNTEPKAKRTITLKITLVPSSDRDGSEVDVQVGSKLAAMRSANATIFHGRRSGKMVAICHDPNQLQFQWDEESKPKRLDDQRVAEGE